MVKIRKSYNATFKAKIALETVENEKNLPTVL